MIANGSQVTRKESPTRRDIEVQLDRILSNEHVRLSERSRNFLRFIVRETLAERSRYLKAYTIAESVFAMPDFDAQNNPAVRIAARTIRDELERFYLKSSDPEPVLITLPKGGYVPSFSLNTKCFQPRDSGAELPFTPSLRSGPSGRTARLWSKAIGFGTAAMSLLIVYVYSSAAILVTPYQQALPPIVVVEPIDNAETLKTADFLRDQIIVRLVQGRNFAIFLRSAGPGKPEMEFLLQTSIQQAGKTTRLTARVVRQGDLVVLWSDHYDFDSSPATSYQTDAEVAANVVQDVTGTIKRALP
ncbi:putative integral membrane protein [Rhizobium leguminosarum bv. trifolii WSM2012]|nr:putative integral membrane protein [Rhizobium leguminosarum bv. trifolii WSM2012]